MRFGPLSPVGPRVSSPSPRVRGQEKRAVAVPNQWGCSEFSDRSGLSRSWGEHQPLWAITERTPQRMRLISISYETLRTCENLAAIAQPDLGSFAGPTPSAAQNAAITPGVTIPAT